MPDILTPAELEVFGKLNEARTPGEWKWDSYSTIYALVPQGHFLDTCEPDTERPVGIIAGVNGGLGQHGDELIHPEAKANADFIAACSVMVPKLLATVKALREAMTDAAQKDAALEAWLKWLAFPAQQYMDWAIELTKTAGFEWPESEDRRR